MKPYQQVNHQTYPLHNYRSNSLTTSKLHVHAMYFTWSITLVLVDSMFICSHFKIWIHCSIFHYKMSEMLTELGPYFLVMYVRHPINENTKSLWTFTTTLKIKPKQNFISIFTKLIQPTYSPRPLTRWGASQVQFIFFLQWANLIGTSFTKKWNHGGSSK